MHHTRFLRSSLDIEARLEEENMQISSGSFTAYYSKNWTKCFWILTAVMFVISILSTIGAISSFIDGDLTIFGLICLAVFFWGMTLLSLSCIPTLASYRCYIDNDSLREEYLVLFLKRRKTVSWGDIKYIKIQKDKSDNIRSVCFFDCNKKRLLDLSSSVVGLTHIIKKAKRKQIAQYCK